MPYNPNMNRGHKLWPSFSVGPNGPRMCCPGEKRAESVENMRSLNLHYPKTTMHLAQQTIEKLYS